MSHLAAAIPVCGFALAAIVLAAAAVNADDLVKVEETKPPRKNWSEDVEQSAQRFEVYPSVDAETPTKKVAAYKWSNAARKVAGDRLCLLYIHEGRPVASCKVYPTGQSIVHTFISFTDEPIVAIRDEVVVWSPPKASPTFTKFPVAKPPQSTAAGRRVQLKSLARRFSAETGPGEAKRQSSVPELRLLPQPLYRYEITDTGQDGVIDGAVFCFVANGGNPQVLLMVEAVREGDSVYWQYGASRRTLAKLKVALDNEIVWLCEFVPSRDMTSTSDFFKLELPAR